jgi:hypothetical protein
VLRPRILAEESAASAVKSGRHGCAASKINHVFFWSVKFSSIRLGASHLYSDSDS